MSDRNLSSGRSERHFTRQARLVVCLAVLLLVTGVAQKAYRLSLPTTGWSTLEAVGPAQPILERNLLGNPSPLQPGDALLAFEGMSYEVLAPRARAFAPPPESFQAGEAVRFTISRQGEVIDLEVPLYHWTPAALMQALLLRLKEDYATLLGLLIATFVFWQRPRSTAAQLLFLFYVTKMVIGISRVVAPQTVADALFPLAALSSTLFSHLSYTLLLAPLILHLCFSFPEPKPLLNRYPRLLWLIYGLPCVLFFTLPPHLLIPVTGVYALLGALAFFHTFVTATDPVRRAQVRWVTFGFAAASLSWLLWVLGALDVLDGLLIGMLVAPSELILIACLAVALLRYRLFDIDLVINRTLVYLSLSACVVALYVLVVGSLGTLLQLQGNLLVSLVATGLVAVLFQPLRERLQRSVDRLMYGERNDPYRLLAKLSQDSAATLTPQNVIPTMLKTVVHGLKLPYGSVLLYLDDDEVVAEQGHAATEPVVFPLLHQGERIGEMHVEPRSPTEPFTPADMHLLETVAQQVSVAAHSVRQTLELKRSRERLITTREEERLRIRRDLHDGLGPTLAGLNLQVNSLRRLIRDDPATEAAVNELRNELKGAIGEIRGLVYDLRPPSLDQLGLTGALKQLTENLSPPGDPASVLPGITLALPESLCLPPATEVAVYRIVQEALTNVVKHAQAHSAMVMIELGRELNLCIQDDGQGMREGYRAGVGLRSMRERAEELGGQLHINAQPGQGTRISVRLPLPIS
jgi:signal transduction histidine kinase